MGYTTDFYGEFDIVPPLKPEHTAYLRKFSETRRMQHDPFIAAQLADPERLAVGLPIGKQGEYFTGEPGFRGQGALGGGPTSTSVTEYNSPPASQPGLWCQWIPDTEGTTLAWDEGEKFYEYVEWLQYLIEHFLGPWGYSLVGEVNWQGEERDDNGKIVITSPSNDIQIYETDVQWHLGRTIHIQNKR